MKKVILIFSLILFVFCSKKDDLNVENKTSVSLKIKSKQKKYEKFLKAIYI
jgi:hypothetical protein